MRSFSDKEKAIINKLISIKRNSKLEELQVARLLREQLSCFAIKWSNHSIFRLDTHVP